MRDWAKVFKTTEEEKKRYGADEYGTGLILAGISSLPTPAPASSTFTTAIAG